MPGGSTTARREGSYALALQLADYVLFSTHGLLASETGLYGKPGLFTARSVLQSDMVTRLFAAIERHSGAPGAAVLALRAKEETSSPPDGALLAFIGTTDIAAGPTGHPRR